MPSESGKSHNLENKGGGVLSDCAHGLLLIAISFFVFRDALDLPLAGDSLALAHSNVGSIFENLMGRFQPESFGWRPVAVLTFALDRVLWGNFHKGSMITQLFMAGLSSWLLYLLARRLSESNIFAFSAALAFLLLPLHHENVFSLAGRGPLLGFIFLAGAMALWPEQASGKIRLGKIAAISLAALGMGASPLAFLFPFLLSALILMERFKEFGGLNLKAALRESAAAWIVTAAALIVRGFFLFQIERGGRVASGTAQDGFFSDFIDFMQIASQTGRTFGVLSLVFIALLFSVGIVAVSNFRKREKSDIANLAWASSWFIGLIPLAAYSESSAMDAYLPSAGIALYLGILAYALWRSGPLARLRRPALLLFSVLYLVIALMEIQAAAGDWRDAGPYIRNVEAELSRLAPFLNSTKKESISIYNLKTRIGGARAIRSSLSGLAGVAEWSSEIRSAGEFNGEAYLKFLDSRGETGKSYWLWEDGENRLMRLVSEDTKPDNFRLAFRNCLGRIGIRSFSISERYRKARETRREVKDLRRWPMTGEVEFEDGLNFDIKSGEVVFHAPKTSGPLLSRLASLELEIERDPGSDNCEVALMVFDKAAPGDYGDRVLLRNLDEKFSWRLSVYERGINSWFTHVALADSITERKTWDSSETLDFMPGRRYRGETVSFENPNKAEGARFKLRLKAADGYGKVVNGLIAWRPDGESPWREKHSQKYRFVPGPEFRRYAIGFESRAQKLGEIAVLAPVDAGELKLSRMEIIRPLKTPVIRFGEEGE